LCCLVFEANWVEENKTIEYHSYEIPREVIEIIIYDPPEDCWLFYLLIGRIGSYGKASYMYRAIVLFHYFSN
jgi:hypothetical protein